MEDNRRRIGRRASDHEKEANIRDNLYLAERVVSERLNCEPKELVDFLQDGIKSKRRWAKYRDFGASAFTGALMWGVVGLIGAAIVVLWRHLIKQ